MLIKFDNCKKLSKVTKLSKRLIQTVNNIGLFDVGYREDYYADSLVIATDESPINPYVVIHRTDWGKIAVHKWHGANHETTWYNTESQNYAFIDAITWMYEQRLIARA